MALRIIHWLRHPKDHQELRYPASPMPEVKRALNELQELGLDIWSDDSAGAARSPLLVDRRGKVIVVGPTAHHTADGQTQLDVLDLLGPFEMELAQGPDLIRPRAHLRIVPGKVSGEPHLEHSRLTTLTVAALADRGYDAASIAELYPDEAPAALAEAVELEQALAATRGRPRNWPEPATGCSRSRSTRTSPSRSSTASSASSWTCGSSRSAASGRTSRACPTAHSSWRSTRWAGRGWSQQPQDDAEPLRARRAPPGQTGDVRHRGRQTRPDTGDRGRDAGPPGCTAEAGGGHAPGVLDATPESRTAAALGSLCPRRRAPASDSQRALRRATGQRRRGGGGGSPGAAAVAARTSKSQISASSDGSGGSTWR